MATLVLHIWLVGVAFLSFVFVLGYQISQGRATVKIAVGRHPDKHKTISPWLAIPSFILAWPISVPILLLLTATTDEEG